MKRWIAILLALVLVLAMAGCNVGGVNTDEENSGLSAEEQAALKAEQEAAAGTSSSGKADEENTEEMADHETVVQNLLQNYPDLPGDGQYTFEPVYNRSGRVTGYTIYIENVTYDDFLSYLTLLWDHGYEQESKEDWTKEREIVPMTAPDGSIVYVTYWSDGRISVEIPNP